MSYTRVNWKDRNQSPDTPLNAHNLNIMDKGIEDLDQKTSNATVEKVGLVKPDGITTKISADGTITAINGGGGGASVATQVSYNDGVTQLGADNVQTAIENIVEKNADWLKSKNLVFKVIEKASIDGSGKITSNNSYDVAVAKVKEDKTYCVSNGTGVYAFFVNEPILFDVSYDGQRIIDTSSNVFTVPSGCNYVAYRINIGEKQSQIEEGTSATPYQPFSESNVELTDKVSHIYNDGFASRNLFIKSTAILGSRYSENGTIQTGYTTYHMQNIPIKGDNYYTVSCVGNITNSASCVWLDENMSLIGVAFIRVSPDEITLISPLNARYLGVSVHDREFDIFQVEEGQQATSYDEGVMSNAQITEDLYKYSYTPVNVVDTSLVSIEGGGYARLGNLVVVNLRLKILKELSQANTNILVNQLPTPNGTTNFVSVSSNYSGVGFSISTSGELSKSSSALCTRGISANQIIILNTVYLAK